MVSTLLTFALFAFLLALATGSWIVLLVSFGLIVLATILLFCLGSFSRWPMPR